MTMTFRLDGCHYLAIDTDVARTAGDHRSVQVQINYRGLPSPEGDCPPDRVIGSFGLTPSQTRAIASALLSAATEARA